MPRLIFSQVVTKRIEHAIVNWIISSFGRVIVIDLIDTIRLKPRNLACGELPSEVKRSLDYAPAERCGCQRSRIDIRRDAAAAIKHAARRRAKRRRIGTAQLLARFTW